MSSWPRYLAGVTGRELSPARRRLLRRLTSDDPALTQRAVTSFYEAMQGHIHAMDGTDPPAPAAMPAGWRDRLRNAHVLDLWEALRLVRLKKVDEGLGRIEEILRRLEGLRMRCLGRQAAAGERGLADYYATAIALVATRQGEVLAGAGRHEEADRAYARAMAAQPDLTQVRMEAAGAAAARGEWARAEAMLRAGWPILPGPAARGALAAGRAWVFERYQGWARAQKTQASAAATGREIDEEIETILPRLEAGRDSRQIADLRGWQGRLRFLRAGLIEETGDAADAAAIYRSGSLAYDEAAVRQEAQRLSAAYLAELAGDTLARAGRLPEAATGYALSRERLHGLDDPPARLSLERTAAKEALLALTLGDAAAGDRHAKAYSKGWPGPWQRMALEGGPALGQPVAARRLRLALDARLRQTLDAVHARDLAHALREVWRHGQSASEERLRPPLQGGAALPEIIEPIAIELDERLLALEGPAEPAALRHMRQLRERVRESHGVELPGIHVRSSGRHLGYRLLLHGQPVAAGTLPHSGRVLLVCAHKRLGWLKRWAQPEQLGLAGAEAWWVPALLVAPRWLRARLPRQRRGAAPEIWTAVTYIFRHLEAVLIRDLRAICGRQEVYSALLRQKLVDTTSDRGLAMAETALTITPLTRLIQALLAERTPIVDLPAIHRRFLELEATRADAMRMLAEIRQLPELRPRLWGNEGARRSLLLGPRLTQALRSPERGDGSALEGCVCEVVQRAEAAGEGPALLIVPVAAQRARVRAMLAAALPELPVLAAAEAASGLLAQASVVDAEGEIPASPPQSPVAPAMTPLPDIGETILLELDQALIEEGWGWAASRRLEAKAGEIAADLGIDGPPRVRIACLPAGSGLAGLLQIGPAARRLTRAEAEPPLLLQALDRAVFEGRELLVGEASAARLLATLGTKAPRPSVSLTLASLRMAAALCLPTEAGLRAALVAAEAAAHGEDPSYAGEIELERGMADRTVVRVGYALAGRLGSGAADLADAAARLGDPLRRDLFERRGVLVPPLAFELDEALAPSDWRLVVNGLAGPALAAASEGAGMPPEIDREIDRQIGAFFSVGQLEYRLLRLNEAKPLLVLNAVERLRTGELVAQLRAQLHAGRSIRRLDVILEELLERA